MFLGLAVTIFGIFFLNVFWGATGGTPYLGEVTELLTLAISVLFFVAAILKAETTSKKNVDK